MNKEQELINRIEALTTQVYQLKILISNLSSPESKNWMNIKELSQYIPDKPSINTIYAWVGQRKIPYHKSKGLKKLKFSKLEIDAWIENSDKSNSKDDILSLFR